MKSRLSRNLEKKSEKKLILNVVGIIVVLFLLIKFGIPSLINFSVFLSNVKGSQDSTKSKTITAVPILDQSFTATNSATISVSGSAAPKEKVIIYVNDSLTDTVRTKDDGTFIFKDVTLTLGSNSIKVKAKNDSGESDFSDTQTIVYKSSVPALLIEEPADGQSFSKDTTVTTVKGKTDPNVKITVNDFWAVEDDSGNYSYNLTLQNGDNQIKVVAVDLAGNRTEKDIKVTKAQ